MAAFEEGHDRVGAIPIHEITREMQEILQHGKETQADTVHFQSHMVTFADRRDRTVVVIKEIGKRLLSNDLSIENRTTLTEMIKQYEKTLSIITKEKISQIDPKEQNRCLLCALQIREICLTTLYRGSVPPDSATADQIATLVSGATKKMAALRKVRLAKIKALRGEEIHSEVAKLDRALTDLSVRYTASFPSTSQTDLLETGFVDVSSKELRDKDAMISNRQNVLDEFTAMAPKLESLGIIADSLYFSPEATPDEVQLQTELVKNRLVNSQLFLGQVNRFVDANKRQIVAQLRPDLRTDREIAIHEIRHHDTLSETHNGGRSLVEVVFTVDGTEIKCLLKPRRADIDAAAIDSFRALNAAAPPEAPGYPLPDYVIIQPEHGDRWSEMHGLEEVSLWQFVEGKTVREASFGPKNFSKTTDADRYATEFPKLNMQQPLRKMAAIFANMKIVDQHQDNILVTHLNRRDRPTAKSRLVPIDMEVRGEGRSELGVSPTNYLPLEDWEIQCIKTHFHDPLEKKHCITRIVLVATEDLLRRLRGCVNNTGHILDSVERLRTNFSKEYDMVSVEKMIPHFIEDFLNDDVPYLSEKRGLLYYGLPSRGIIVGTKK